MDGILNNKLASTPSALSVDEILKNEFDRYVSETGNYIIEKVRESTEANKKKAVGQFFIGPFPLTNSKIEVLVFNIKEEYASLICDSVESKDNYISVDENSGHYDLFVAKNENGEAATNFRLFHSFIIKKKSPTFTRFVNELENYLKPHGITISCKLYKIMPAFAIIDYKYKAK